MKDVNLELANPQSNAIFPGFFPESLVWELEVWSNSIALSWHHPKKGVISSYFILRVLQVDTFLKVFPDPVEYFQQTWVSNHLCAGKLLELPGNTVEGAQENIGRTYDVASWNCCEMELRVGIC